MRIIGYKHLYYIVTLLNRIVYKNKVLPIIPEYTELYKNMYKVLTLRDGNIILSDDPSILYMTWNNISYWRIVALFIEVYLRQYDPTEYAMCTDDY